jgi:hypothetical protein
LCQRYGIEADEISQNYAHVYGYNSLWHPMEFDTGTNESGHKPTKKAALLTQKREDTFDQQVERQR